MSSNIQDAQSELKKQFLGILINIDFQASQELIFGHYTNTLKIMHNITSTVYALVQNQNEIQKLYKKLDQWLDNGQYTEKDIKEARKELSEILAKNFYSDLQLSLIPTSALEGKDQKPGNKPADPNKTSRV
jgi:L-rhamnose isomerase